MSYQDFLSHYDGCGVVFFSEKWAESRTAIQTSDDVLSAVLEFEVEAEADAFFTLMQRDTRIKNAPPYIELAFAVYGPLDRHGRPERELLRSHCWSARELVEERLGANKLKPGKYLFAVFNPDKVGRRDIAAVIQLDENGKEHRHDVSATQRRLDVCCSAGPDLPSHRRLEGAVVRCSASSGVEVSTEECPDAQDFSSCSGLSVVDPRSGGRGDKTVKVGLSSGMKLVAELEPDPNAEQFSFGYRISYKESSRR
ncbi:unnamed protein product [Prorocentrum cordatum]|uniref:Uncharacterized protein n=1 Tax=Prorocentrum cordatum TaxID=2364126 RepID=A0ABN9VRB2_9DINO|nr:unnamed protein product [Polarella glacialis]